MFYVSDAQGKKSDMFPTKGEAIEHLQSLERLADALRCKWEYSTENDLVVSDDDHVLNIFSVYETAQIEHQILSGMKDLDVYLTLTTSMKGV